METKEKLRGKEIEKKTEEPFRAEIEQTHSKTQGWNLINSKGFPDYLLYNKKTNELIIYELKANKHEFHPFQKQIIKILTEAKTRSAKVVYYKVDLITGDVKKEKEVNALEQAAKKNKCDWEGVEDIGII